MTNTINNNTAIRTSNTPGTIAFILALVSVAIWTFVGIEFFIIRDQMMNSIVRAVITMWMRSRFSILSLISDCPFFFVVLITSPV